jgi:beta-glucuronidase
MRRAACLVLLFVAPVFGRTFDLAGFWDFRYDPDGRGEAAAWQSADTAQGWTRTQVPGSYNQALRNNVLYQGKAWYRTNFETDLSPGERAILRFDGVAIRAKVWVNGTLAGGHLFPYTGFSFDVTGLLRHGANRLTVLADNQLLKDAIPDTSCTGWWNYGGINRGVFLEIVPEVYLSSINTTTRRNADGTWDFAINAIALNRGRAAIDGFLNAILTDPSGREAWNYSTLQHLAAGETWIEARGTLRRPAAWSPETPSLYKLIVTLHAGASLSERSARVGFRQIEVKGTRILLNGSPVFFKGVNYHEMYPGAGMTLSREQVRKDLADMKALGCNFVRLAHYSHDDQVYDVADEMGLMLWSEIPAWQTRAETLGSDAVWQQYGAPQLREMIGQRRGHPSVVAWSVGNEFPSDREPVARYVTRATALVRELDPTRLVTFASDRRERDISFDSVDFIAINEYFGWYYGAIPDLAPNLDKLHQKWPSKPIVVSEFGAEGILGWENPMPPDSGMDYSEDHQMKLVGTHLGYILDPARAAYMAGALLWVYADFPNPSAFQRSAAHPPIAAYMNCKGLVTDDRRHKRVWQVVHDAFTPR